MCNMCQIQNRQSKGAFHVSRDFLSPWSKVSVDLFSLKGDDYIIVIGFYSKFTEMIQLRNLTSYTKLKVVFDRHVISDILISDNA